MTFDEFVSLRTPQQEKYHQMLGLIPKFAIGKSNGRSIAEMCQFLSEHTEEFRGMTGEQVNRLYKYVKARYASAIEGKGGEVVQPVANRAWEAAFVGGSNTSAKEDAPLVATAPVAPPAENTGPQSQTVEDSAPQKSQESERERIQRGIAERHAARAASAEAIKKLEALGEEAGAWAAEKYQDLARMNKDHIWTEWLNAEPGRRQMVDELVRTAFRGSDTPEVADREKLSDSMLMKFSSQTDLSLGKRVFKATLAATRRVA